MNKDIEYKKTLRKLIIYTEPFRRYRADIIIQLPQYKLCYDKKLDIFYKEYNLFFNLPEDMKEYIIDILYNDLKKKKLNMTYLTKIRNIQQIRKEIKFIFKCAKGKYNYKKMKSIDKYKHLCNRDEYMYKKY